MRGLNTIIIILIIIGANIIFLLTMTRLYKALLSFLISIDKDTILNALGTVNFYSALSLGDFYYFGGIRPINAKNFTFYEDSPDNTLVLDFLVGEAYLSVDLNSGQVSAAPRNLPVKHVFEFPKYGVFGTPFKSDLVSDVEDVLGEKMVPVIKGLGKEVTEYGYMGGAGIAEIIVDVCRTSSSGRELFIDSYITVKNWSDRGIIINGVYYDLSGMPCKVSKINYSGYAKKIVVSYTSSGNESYISVEVMSE